MALSEYEIAILRGAISPELADSEQELSISKAIELVRFFENLTKNTETSNTKLFNLEEMFKNPSIVLSTAIIENRPEELSKPTVGDARQKIIELVGLNITWQTQKLRINNRQIGWDTSELIKQVKEIPQNEIEIEPPQESVSEEEEDTLTERIRHLQSERQNMQISQERLFKDGLEKVGNLVQAIQEEVERIESIIEEIQRSIEVRRQTGGETAVLNRQLELFKSQKESIKSLDINVLLSDVNKIIQNIQRVIEERQLTGGRTEVLNSHMEYAQRLQESIQGLIINRGNLMQFSNVQNENRRLERSNSLEGRRTSANTNHERIQPRRRTQSF